MNCLCETGDDWVDDWTIEDEGGGLDSVGAGGGGELSAASMVLVDLEVFLLPAAADRERLDRAGILLCSFFPINTTLNLED